MCVCVCTCTAAWSLAAIMRLVAEHLRGVYSSPLFSVKAAAEGADADMMVERESKTTSHAELTMDGYVDGKNMFQLRFAAVSDEEIRAKSQALADPALTGC